MGSGSSPVNKKGEADDESEKNAENGTGSDASITYSEINPKTQVSKTRATPSQSESQPGWLVLGEELIHALATFDGVRVPDSQTGINTYLYSDGRGYWESQRLEELYTHGIGNFERPKSSKRDSYPSENALRAEHGMDPRRSYELMPPAAYFRLSRLL